jgi:RhoGEF domain
MQTKILRSMHGAAKELATEEMAVFRLFFVPNDPKDGKQEEEEEGEEEEEKEKVANENDETEKQQVEKWSAGDIEGIRTIEGKKCVLFRPNALLWSWGHRDDGKLMLCADPMLEAKLVQEVAKLHVHRRTFSGDVVDRKKSATKQDDGAAGNNANAVRGSDDAPTSQLAQSLCAQPAEQSSSDGKDAKAKKDASKMTDALLSPRSRATLNLSPDAVQRAVTDRDMASPKRRSGTANWIAARRRRTKKVMETQSVFDAIASCDLQKKLRPTKTVDKSKSLLAELSGGAKDSGGGANAVEKPLELTADDTADTDSDESSSCSSDEDSFYREQSFFEAESLDDVRNMVGFGLSRLVAASKAKANNPSSSSSSAHSTLADDDNIAPTTTTATTTNGTAISESVESAASPVSKDDDAVSTRPSVEASEEATMAALASSLLNDIEAAEAEQAGSANGLLFGRVAIFVRRYVQQCEDREMSLGDDEDDDEEEARRKVKSGESAQASDEAANDADDSCEVTAASDSSEAAAACAESTAAERDKAASPASKKDAAERAAGRRLKRKMFGQRAHVMKEIMIVEKHYVNNLTIMVEVFKKPLSREKILNDSDTRMIFASIEQVYKSHKALLGMLMQRFHEWETLKVAASARSVGDIFRNMNAYLQGYAQFISNYIYAIKVVKMLEASHEGFQAFCKRPIVKKSIGSFALSDYLILPVQQVPRYIMLFEQLLSTTPESHPDHADLKHALTNVRSVAVALNEVTRRSENGERMASLRRRITGGLAKLKACGLADLDQLPSRMHVHEGVMLMYSGRRIRKKNRRAKKATLYHMVLLSDALLTTKMMPPPSSTSSSSSSSPPASLDSIGDAPVTRAGSQSEIAVGAIELDEGGPMHLKFKMAFPIQFLALLPPAASSSATGGDGDGDEESKLARAINKLGEKALLKSPSGHSIAMGGASSGANGSASGGGGGKLSARSASNLAPAQWAKNPLCIQFAPPNASKPVNITFYVRTAPDLRQWRRLLHSTIAKSRRALQTSQERRLLRSMSISMAPASN